MLRRGIDAGEAAHLRGGKLEERSGVTTRAPIEGLAHTANAGADGLQALRMGADRDVHVRERGSTSALHGTFAASAGGAAGGTFVVTVLLLIESAAEMSA